MILLTGASGFVGSKIFNILKETTDKELIATSRSSKDEIFSFNLLTNKGSLIPWNKIKIVIHAASLIPAKGEIDYFHNIILTKNLLDRLPVDKITSFVLISSVAVYNIDQNLPEVILNENSQEITTSDYGRSKIIQEWLIKEAAKYRFPLTILRPSSIYGAGNKSKTLLPIFKELAQSNSTLTLKGPKNYNQNFIHVDDVANIAVKSAIEMNSNGIFNLFSNETMNTFTLAERIIAHYHSNSKIEDNRNDLHFPNIIFDNSKLLKEFDINLLTLEEGLDR